MVPFIPGTMQNFYPGDAYTTTDRSASIFTRMFTTPSFYYRMYLVATRWLAKKAWAGCMDSCAVAYGSSWGREICERTGMRIHVEGLDVLNDKNPCVIIANHMSTLETFLLPGMILPRKPVVLVIKRSLAEMRGFGPIMTGMGNIIVDRKNPRKDLETVLKEGCRCLESGTSVIVFPQSTRMTTFDPSHFNTIGVKLARHANVPVVPLVLKTDAWSTDGPFKELGKIKPSIDSIFKFFPPITITGNGKKEHAAISQAIRHTLHYWNVRQNALDVSGRELPFCDENFAFPL